MSLSLLSSLFQSIMNLFGVLKYKKMGEDFLCSSGLPFTIIRSVTLDFVSFAQLSCDKSYESSQ